MKIKKVLPVLVALITVTTLVPAAQADEIESLAAEAIGIDNSVHEAATNHICYCNGTFTTTNQQGLKIKKTRPISVVFPPSSGIDDCSALNGNEIFVFGPNTNATVSNCSDDPESDGLIRQPGDTRPERP